MSLLVTTIRRPDAHTLLQRHSERVRAIIQGIELETSKRYGWSSQAIAEVRREDERRGARCRGIY